MPASRSVEIELPDIKELLEKTGMPIALYETMIDLPAYFAEHDIKLSLPELTAGIESPDVRGLFDMLCKDENGDGQPDGLIPKAVYDEAMNQHRPALSEIFENAFQHQPT